MKTRRLFLKVCGVASLAAQPRETYDTQAKGLRIVPGAWRPHYPWEHIAWISPPWPSQDYLWLDFPEAIFTTRGLHFLSHINPAAPALYGGWPAVSWRPAADGIAFERELPDGVRFGGSLTRSGTSLVEMELFIRNQSKEPLARITLQTCAFLRAIREFADYTLENKFVHTAAGWMPLNKALAAEAGAGPYRVGWRRSGKLVADWPVLATVSNRGPRLVAMTWNQATLSMVGNPNHPCMHADPVFPNLAPGEGHTIRGRLIFFEGKLEDFDFRRYLL
ncbi:MAG: hypothetical protein ACKV22_14265 [Bryobacteraceae bacterium]